MVRDLIMTNKYTIEGIPVDVQNFRFTLQPGVEPSEMTLILPNTQAERILQKIGGNRTATIVWETPDPVRKEPTKKTFKNMILMEPRAETQYTIRLVFKDRRFDWQYFRITGFYNKRRRANDFIQLDAQGLLSVNKVGYIANTLKSKTDTPWTCAELLEEIIRQGEDRIEEESLARVLEKDNGYFLDNQDLIAELFPDVLAKYMSPAYIMINWDPELDIIYFYKPDDGVAALNEFSEFYMEGGGMIASFASIRPSEVRQAALIEREMVLTNEGGFTNEFAPSGFSGNTGVTVKKNPAPDSGFLEGKAPLIQNVLPLPQNLTEADGETIKARRNQWIPFDDAIEFWAEQDLIDASFNKKGASLRNINDEIPREVFNFAPDNTWANKSKSVNYKLHLALWFGNLLQYWYGLNLEVGNPNAPGTGLARFLDPERLARIALIRRHFRQTFKIESGLLSHILAWHTRSVEIVDTATGARALNPVYTQYCVVPALRPPELGNGVIGKKIKASKITNVAFNVDDFKPFVDNDGNEIEKRVNLNFADLPNGAISFAGLEGRSSPFQITILDQDLGIFRVDPLPDLSGVIGQIIPSMVDNFPALTYSNLGNIIWQRAALTKDFQIKVYLSMFLMPQENVKFDAAISDREGGNKIGDAKTKDAEGWTINTTTVKPTSNDGVGLGPPLDIFTNRDTARFRANGDFENKEIIESLAQAEAKRIYFSYRDRPLGIFSYRGLRNIRSVGHVTSVTWQVNIEGEAVTIVDFHMPPAPPPVFSLLTRGARAVVFRQILDGTRL